MRAYAVFHLIGWVLAVLAATMLLPIVFALKLDSIAVVQAFVIPALAIGFLGGILILAFRDRSILTGRWESLLLLGLVWLVVPLAAALPFYTAGYPKGVADALFEATSGFTTTGATALLDLSQAPRSIIIWRSVLQWLGGLTTLLTLVTILGPLSGTNLLDRQLRIIGLGAHGSVRHMLEAVRSITPAYGALTMACFMGLVFSGIPAFDAFCLALSTLSTGGFMPREGTIAVYGSATAELCLAFFMAAGAVSVLWIRATLQMRWAFVRVTTEPLWIIGLIVCFGTGLGILLMANTPGTSWSEASSSLTLGLATAASIVSTTGLPISDNAQDMIPYMLLLGLCILGGGRFSTAGGLKVYRVLSMLRQTGRELRLLIYPHGVRPARHGEESRDVEIIKSAWIMLAAFIIAAGALAITLAASGLLFSGALLASAGALSNMGPIYEIARGVNFPEAPAYGEMTSLAQISLCIGMVFGRVEILALLTFVNLANWRD